MPLRGEQPGQRPPADEYSGSDPLERATVDASLERTSLCVRKTGGTDEFDVVCSAHADSVAQCAAVERHG
ncbi:hypothetical protein GCM10017714_09610 [Curtobacterium pusillum]|nr:hypothetical protein GCM10017610_05080 [Curtobacterium pusillum]